MSKLSDKIEEGGKIGRNVDSFHQELLLDLEARIEALEGGKPEAKQPPPSDDKPHE